jgi:hypothetical protein
VLVLLLNLTATAYMAGVSWLVSLVVYPAFLLVGEGEWARYHEAHTQRITPVVLPGMVVELGTSGWIALAPPVDGVPTGLAWAGLALAVASWALTGLVAVPDHGRLERGGPDERIARRLIRGHHLRTLAWSAHLVVALLLVAGSL